MGSPEEERYNRLRNSSVENPNNPSSYTLPDGNKGDLAAAFKANVEVSNSPFYTQKQKDDFGAQTKADVADAKKADLPFVNQDDNTAALLRNSKTALTSSRRGSFLTGPGGTGDVSTIGSAPSLGVKTDGSNPKKLGGMTEDALANILRQRGW